MWQPNLTLCAWLCWPGRCSAFCSGPAGCLSPRMKAARGLPPRQTGHTWMLLRGELAVLSGGSLQSTSRSRDRGSAVPGRARKIIVKRALTPSAGMGASGPRGSFPSLCLASRRWAGSIPCALAGSFWVPPVTAAATSDPLVSCPGVLRASN